MFKHKYFGIIIFLVTVKTFGLLPDRAWIWLDFPDFKQDYIKKVYRSNVCFAGHGMRTGDFHSDCFFGTEFRIFLENLDNTIGTDTLALGIVKLVGPYMV